MCGIFGLMNGAKNRSYNLGLCKAFGDGVALNSIRGVDSVGIMQRDKKTIYTDRTLGTGMDYVRTASGRIHVDGADTALFTVAHNRAATEGSINLNNCHPFEAIDDSGKEYVIGVHNGTLTGWKKHNSPFDVDSEWAISRLAQSGEAAFKEFYGAWCFVWADYRDSSVLNICRNSARPMYISYIKNQDRMLFASEYQMLTWIAERNDIELEPEIINLQPGQIYKFEVDNPRRFTRTTMPVPAVSSTSGTSSLTAWEERRTNDFIEGLKNIIIPNKVKTPPATNTVSTVPRGPTTPLPPTQVATTMLSAGEVRVAKAAELYQREVVFEGSLYDQSTREYWGACIIDGLVYPSVIRGVSPGSYEAWRDKETMTVTIVGASSEGDGTGTKDMSLIVSTVTNLRRVVEEAKKNREDLESNRAGEDLAAHIAANIEKFQESNSNAQQQLRALL